MDYTLNCAVVVVEGATVTSFVTETATMLIIGFILSMFGIGLFCWLIFTLAVYALPFFVGLTAGMAAFHSGAGVLGALLVGIVTGAVTPVIGQIAFAVVRPPVLRAVIAASFAIPAAIAGYHAVLGLSKIGVPSLVWREVFAWIGALFIGGTSWARMTAFAEPLPLGPSGASQNYSQPVLLARCVRVRPSPFPQPVVERSGAERSCAEIVEHAARIGDVLRRCIAIDCPLLIVVRRVAERPFGDEHTRPYLRHGFLLYA